MPLMNAQSVIFTMLYFYVHANNTVTSLVISSALHNNKQYVPSIGVWDQFLSIWRHF